MSPRHLRATPHSSTHIVSPRVSRRVAESSDVSEMTAGQRGLNAADIFTQQVTARTLK